MNPKRIISRMVCAGLCLTVIFGTILPSSATPDIAIGGAAIGWDLTDGGPLEVGCLTVSRQKSFDLRIRNTGSTALTGLAITQDGPQSAEFTTGTPSATTLLPGATCVFSITFSPGASGVRSAVLHIASNDPDESPFDIAISGIGAGSGQTMGDYGYVIVNDTVFIDHYRGLGGSVTVPATLGGLPVTMIGPLAFSDPDIRSISIPASVTTIGELALLGCSGLIEITVDDSNPHFISLNGVLFDKAQTKLVKFPGGRSGAYAIPPGVTTIGTSAFMDCATLSSIGFPASLVAIQGLPFPNCSGLSSITVDAANPSFRSEGGVLFDKNLGTLIQYPPGKSGPYVIPSGVTNIGYGAFLLCADLTGLTIPASVASIGTIAFAGCTALPEVAVSANVTCLGDAAFASCVELAAITVDAANPNYSGAGGVMFSKPSGSLIQYPGGKPGSYAIPADVTDIRYLAFSGCRKLVSVTIPAGVTRIEGGTFSDCGDLISAAFLGNAPVMGRDVYGNQDVFSGVAAGFTVRYLPDSKGFSTPTWIVSPFVEEYPAAPFRATQEIEVLQAGVPVPDGGAVVLGSVSLGSSANQTLILLNSGGLDLTGLSVSKSGNHPADFTVDPLGSASLAPGMATTVAITFAPSAVGIRSCTLRIASNDTDESPYDLVLTGTGSAQDLSVAAAVDQPGSNVTHGGQAPWFWQGMESHDGADAAQSGPISHYQSSSFSITATGPGTVSFWWLVSSEEDFDFLSFHVDGIKQREISGTMMDWTQVSVTLGPGNHTLRWTYAKDEDWDEGGDCGWVDQVVLPAVAAPLETWRQTYFGTTANTGNAGNTADPDQDGLNNLLEFAIGLHPMQPSAHLAPKWQRVGGALTVTFIQPAGVGGITYGAEWSTTMTGGTWQPLADTGIAPQHTFSVPIDSSQRKFVRLKVTAP